MHFIAVVIIAQMLTGIFEFKKKSSMDLTVLEGNRHKHGPTQEILSSTHTPGA